MPDLTLKLLLDEVRAKTLRRLDGVAPDEALWAPPGTRNHILWHAGHVYVVVESLGVKSLGQPGSYPARWPQLFGAGSDPAAVPTDQWPTLDTVVQTLKDQHARIAALLDMLDADALNADSAFRPGTTVRYGFLHGLHDEACHSGEIYLLRKLWAHQNKPAATPA